MLGGKNPRILLKFLIHNGCVSYIFIFLYTHAWVDLSFLPAPPFPSPHHTLKGSLERAQSGVTLKPLCRKRQRESLSELLHGRMQEEQVCLQWNIFCFSTKALPEQLFNPCPALSTVHVWVISPAHWDHICLTRFVPSASSSCFFLVCAMLCFLRQKLSWARCRWCFFRWPPLASEVKSGIYDVIRIQKSKEQSRPALISAVRPRHLHQMDKDLLEPLNPSFTFPSRNPIHI